MLHDLQGLGSLTTIWLPSSEAWDRRASRVCACISGGRNEALKGRTQVCRHQREDVGHSLAEIITPNFLIQIGESEVVEGA